MLTVKELIVQLLDLPPEAPVLIQPVNSAYKFTVKAQDVMIETDAYDNWIGVIHVGETYQPDMHPEAGDMDEAPAVFQPDE